MLAWTRFAPDAAAHTLSCMSTISVEATTLVADLAGRARVASRALALASRATKDAALLGLGEAIEASSGLIAEANAQDVARERAAGMGESLLDRLTLTPDRIGAVAQALRDIAALPDPVGEIVRGSTLANGLQIRQIRVPMGVVGMIYEARPNVTVDAAGLGLKSGNAVILRGGSAAAESNRVLVQVMRDSLAAQGLPPDVAADLGKAAAIVVNAKTSRPSVCNAAESLLVHRDIAADILPGVLADLVARGVVLHTDAPSSAFAEAAGLPHLAATTVDFATEFHGLEISVAVVDSIDAALDHVRAYGSGHTEAIVTEDRGAARRFTDGGEFGFGAEIGISTQKLHARGPMALPELTTTKWIVEGDGHIRP